MATVNIMALDGLLLHRVIQQLTLKLPLRIQRIYDLSDTELLFNVRSHHEKHQLLISTHTIHNRLLLSKQTFSPPIEPSPFVMLLRKHCEEGLITAIHQQGLDRIIRIDIQKRDALGDLTFKHLMVELMGKYANLILCDANFRILDALKRIPLYENSKRLLQPGAAYTYPEAHDKKDPRLNNTIDVQLGLSQQFHGFSPLLAREFDHRMRHGQSFKAIMDELVSSDSIYLYPREQDPIGHCLELTHLNQDALIFPLMEGLDQWYAQQEEKERIKQRTGDLFKLVQREYKKAQQKLPKLIEDLGQSQAFEQYRNYGELLYAYAHQLPKGHASINLLDEATQTQVHIDLDERLDGKANAAKYFQKYQKAKKGQSHIQKQIDLTQQELTYFESLLEQLSLASILDAADIQQELIQQGYVRKRPQASKKKTQIHYYRFDLNATHRILVGKNNYQNEFVTFKLAQKNDLWFHALNYHGAHVVLQGIHPSEEAIQKACQLAMYFSKAKTMTKAEIQMTAIKHLKKIPEGKPGQVIVSQYESVTIDLNESELKQWMTQHSAQL
jgi:predicted ribosome quality control (RQC) complex YloA/Tae2 family protein